MAQEEKLKALGYSAADQMIISAAHEIKDNDIVYVGVGLPMVATSLAMYTHAPSCTIITQNGIVRTTHFPLNQSTDIQSMADHLPGLFSVMCAGQAGFISTGFLGAGQIDRYGNVNSTVVGDYRNPVHRWAGSGGGNDVMSFCKRTIITIRQSKRRFLEKVDFITTPGYLDGRPGQREKEGLPPNTGPSAVITDLGVYGFEDGEMVLKTIHRGVGVTLDKIMAEASWDIKISPDLTDTVPPTEEELRMLREKVDPEKAWVDGRRRAQLPPEEQKDRDSI
ncbi:MAG: CoA-transferase [Dehalococcoidales bacterium]|nr:CoA-transferase [Dehalococcoidales bacterium]